MRSRCGLLLSVLLSAVPLFAQFSGRVAGTVIDSSGAVVPDAQVDLYMAAGKKPLLSTRTANNGAYNFLAVRPADYDLTVEAKGFVKYTLHGLTVDAARETSVPQVKLQLASLAETVEVSDDAQGVEVNNAEIADTVTVDQIKNLPIFDRDPLGLIQLQPGVVSNGNSATVINGLRTSYSDVTLDGVNIQDNYIRDNALDYTPNKLLLGQVRQMTLIGSNANAAASGGATQTAFSTNSGTNLLHGEALWYNRNNFFSANDWFNNQAGVGLPFLNQNQFGLTLGGPIVKDKLFFYFNYEAVRTHSQGPANATILTASAAAGIFTYRNSTGTLNKVNVLALRSLTGVDPTMQKLLAQIPAPSQINNSLVGDGLNTAGYRFNMRSNGIRDNLTGKLDYSINTRHQVSIAYLWNRFNSDRPDLENDYSSIPKATNPTHANFLAASWRWTPTSRLTNELVFGFNFMYAYFFNNQSYPSNYYLTGMLFSDPVNEFQPQGRDTNTVTLADNAGWQHGHHNVQFGFHLQDIRVRSYDASGVIPSYSLAMGSGQPALKANELPGVTINDYFTAQALLATLGGYIDGYAQTVNVTSRSSGYVPGAPFLRNFILNDYATYVQDNWKVAKRLSLTLGLRWEFPGVADEAHSLELLPVLTGSAVQTLLSNATLNFAGGAAGNPWYKRQWKDFAPNAGFAWDVFGNGKTALRGGYSISYVNDQEIIAPENMLEANAGLQGFAGATGLSNTLAGGVPAVQLPTYKVPLSVADNYATNPFNVVATVDPNLHRPYVQQYSFGIQQEFLHTVFEARYVGNHVVGAYRAFDFNQVQIQSNGFLTDFLRAQNNGNLAVAAGKAFSPAYSPLIPGSQPLTVLTKFSGRGDFSDSNVVTLIETGQAGELASYYQTNGLNPTNAVPLFQNPYVLGADMLTNYSSSSYNSLQIVARHRVHSGLTFEANYTFSKVLSDGDGDLQTRFQAFLDLNNPKLERSRANFDLNHMIKADGFYELPIGGRHVLHYHPLDRVIGGWILGATWVWQSGAPFSILSSYGTLNRAVRSYYNTADTTLGGAALAQIVNFQMTGSGPVEVAPSAVNPADHSGVSAPGAANFAGEVFSNPGAGTLGVLQRREFSGPWTFDIDTSLSKTVKFGERQSIELRGDAYNILNHATFYVGDQNINSITFGVISSMFYTPRIMQFGLHYHF